MRRVTSTEFQKKVGLYQDLALSEPLTVTRNGRDKVVVLSAEEYGRLKRRDREVLRVEDLSAEDLEAIAAAKLPADSALRDLLERARRQGGKKIDQTLLRRSQKEIARLPVADDRNADELLEYDEAGLPR
jgi:prevent-host-death family protein